MDVARLNFSHQTIDWHRQRAALVRQISEEVDRPIGLLQDLPGPKVRVGEMPEDGAELIAGRQFLLRMQEEPGSAEQVSVNYAGLSDELEIGDPILLADGSIRLRVAAIEADTVICDVQIGGKLYSHQGLNLPTRSLQLPALTAFDRQALVAGLEMGVDYAALSFVRTGDDVTEARRLIDEHGLQLPIIAKIEKHEALDNLEEIVEAVDGLMVARGDLAVEIPLEDVPQAQKRIIRTANAAAKPVITATQMLRSMVDSPRPSRAETTDVANALYDGTDAVMLSEETAVGHYAVDAVEVMARICHATEKTMCERGTRRPLPEGRRHIVPDAVAAAACLLARHLDAAALVVPTRTGSTAIKIAACRPRQPIVAIGTHAEAVGRMTLVWGVIPVIGQELEAYEAMLVEAEQRAEAAGLVEPGDLLIITAGFPVGGPGSTNTVTAKVAGERLITYSLDQNPASRR